MKKILFSAFILLSIIMCSSRNLVPHQENSQVFFLSSNDGGSGEKDYEIITSQEEFEKIIQKHETYINSFEGFQEKIGKFPKNQILVLYNLGTFRSGQHKPSSINKIELINDQLEVFIETPKTEIGGMEIQVISNPWMIFSVPKSYKFNKIKINSVPSHGKNLSR